MKKHLKYFRYLVLHKWWVLVAGLKTKTPLWQLLIHDLSKFRPSEWFPYADNYYGPKYDESTEDGFLAQHRRNFRYKRAWLLHQNRNAHHWQYWCLRTEKDETIHLPMPDRYMREMVADWLGAGRAKSGKWEALDWYEKHKDNIKLHPVTRMDVEELLHDFTNRVLEKTPEFIAAIDENTEG